MTYKSQAFQKPFVALSLFEVVHVFQCLEKGKNSLPQASNEFFQGNQSPCKTLYFLYSPQRRRV